LRDLAEFYEGKRVFVTGHNGFKGSWLTQWLVQLGANVKGYSLPLNEKSPLYMQLGLDKHVETVIDDVRNIDSLKTAIVDFKPEIIFHLAAQPLVSRGYVDPIGTYSANVMGVINLLESLRTIDRECTAVFVTSDKCYLNQKQVCSFSESDMLGGSEPYSSSKAMAEIAVAAFRESYFGLQSPVRVATARAGNVLGGGDWSVDRIVPDCIRALTSSSPITIRNPSYRRPWQHVLDPLFGYLLLAKKLFQATTESERTQFSSPYNFGPLESDCKTVKELVAEILQHWPGHSEIVVQRAKFQESSSLILAIDKAKSELGWTPIWSFQKTIALTVHWYKVVHEKGSPELITKNQIAEYEEALSLLN
jgi:CDP-glucose 4,6-dehydratase